MNTAMKKILVILVALAGISIAAYAQQNTDVAVSDLKIIKNGEEMNIDMNIDLSKLDVKGQRSVHFLPVIKNGKDSLQLSPIGIYSRGRYINYLRRGESVFQDLGETVYRSKEAPKTFNYSATVPYKSWMDGSEVHMTKVTCGCCQDILGEESEELGGFNIPVFDPHFIYLTPEADLVKKRELSGTAYIDFIVSRTNINPKYRNNASELNKIIASIDSVKNDDDIKVKHISLKGFASPESPYSNNERLAKGRTNALKEYVQGLYDFDDSMFITDYEPENWEDLRTFIETIPYIANKEAILALIDSDMEPDRKEWKIKHDYPVQYDYLYAVCYPGLRKTEYVIEYNIDVYTDVDEIVRIFRTSPNKLSLNELYIASTAFEPGSEEFISVFEAAVRMYPEDEIANLNAANVAMADNRLKDAAKYLDKAGTSVEAEYARGLYLMKTGEYDKAEKIFTEVSRKGIAEAEEMLQQCVELKTYYAENK